MNAGQALYFLDRLLSEGENIFSILVMISRHIRMIFQCKSLNEKGLKKMQYPAKSMLIRIQ